MKETRIEELKNEIEKQKEENVRLFKIFEYKMHKEEVQPLIQEWREGSKKLKAMIKELQELELEMRARNTNEVKTNEKTFVNGFGEATKRNITCAGYDRAEKRNAKAMLLFVGGRN